MSGTGTLDILLGEILGVDHESSDAEIIAEVKRLVAFRDLMGHLHREAGELEDAGRVAAANGMFESGAVLRNKAAGIRRAIEILQFAPDGGLSQEVPK